MEGTMCEHDFVESSIEWEASTGKLMQYLVCKKCLYVSSGFTLPDDEEDDDGLDFHVKM